MNLSMKRSLSHAASTGKAVKMNTKYRYIFILQIILTVFGTALSAYNLVTTAASFDMYSLLSSIIYFAAHITLIVYAYSYFKVQSDRYFKATIYAYIALIGIQIIRGGAITSGYELSTNISYLINTLNLIAFGNLIQFVNRLDSIKISIVYMMMAVLMKSVAEIILIYLIKDQIELYQILMELSIPILGITILIAYLIRKDRK